MEAEAPGLPLGSTTTVRYSQHFEKASDLKLLEVDESVVQELLQSRLSIKGGVEEEAVLCTSRTTYALKFVSTSNTMLLVPPGEAGDGGSGGALHVIATAGGHMELVEIAPRIDQLKVLVGSRPYTEDSENETVDGLYSWEDLLDSVQASEEQLKDGLRALAAAEIGGFWRTVDPKYTKGLLEMILVTAIQQDWSLSLLPLEELVAVLEGDGYPAQLVRHCVATFGVEEPSSSSWKLDEKRICLHYARELLSSTGRWKTNEFLEAWQRALPPGMKGELEMLRGEALVTRLGSDSWLHRFSSSSLPTQPDARFAALFKERSKWEWNDLEPYLRDVRIPGQTVESMLLKYTRKIQPSADARPIYTPR
ncbi:sister chromatid cohesion protein DCC1-like [Selaginella moellendorffii]|uniref:sister chromatid cohesion protein DCC1-like n=1 Tax=Selaginella moellendorffii TaxID=88036 RepID=UPI000D1CD7E7|nr:sister chromatid cohesion protein DCC1-like [Selaginella moellendorffii]|eukprot:XP_024542638.1 sister chromatid cohesion protein DCC1-like [Selaginella moellendorffii]